MALAAAMALSPVTGLGLAVAQESDTISGSSITIDEIIDNPTAYYGQSVTIIGPVEEILGPRSFTISDADPLVSEDLPVVSSHALMSGAEGQRVASDYDGREVQVTGTVHQFNLAAFEDQLGVDLQDSEWTVWAGQPAIIATSITPTSAQQQPGQRPAGTAPMPAVVAWASVDRITDDPATYYGREVAIIGEIGEVLGPRSFTLEDDDLLFDEQMVVVSSRPLTGSDGQAMSLDTLEDRQVIVRGTIHQFNTSAFEERLGINLADEDFSDHAGQPAMIADSIILDPTLYWVVGPSPYGNPANPGAANVDPQTQAQQATVDGIAENPSAYIGRTVTIAGEVGRALGPRSFTVEDNDLLFDEEIAVVGARPLLDRNGQPYSAEALDDLRIMVTGMVRQFVRADLEREFGITFDGADLDGWEGRPVIVADSVRQLR
ncbi:MAG: hypothetical protein IT305_06775 [Chloroflexi bacterium]|nr:hypothetical protein [Chloroflexota bacterium]